MIKLFPNCFNNFNIIDPTDIEAPNIKLDLSGIVNGIITGSTDINGTVTDTNLDYYTLEVARFGTNNWQEVFRDTGNVTNGSLGKFDPSLLENDTYRVRLTAYDTSGRGSQNIGGEPSKVLREDGSYTLYEYDAAVRLSKEVAYTAAGVAIKSITYSYDLDGKRTRKVDNLGTQDYSYNANGQLATAGVNGYSYDADGRLIQVIKSGNTVTLGHDAYDHLTQVTSNGVTTQYRYDSSGNRIGEVSTNGAKNYLVAPNLGNGLASTDLVTDGSGNVVSDYVYGGSQIIARLDANGEPLYYLTDSMGSVIGLVDAAGNIQSRIVYDGFGNVESGDDGSSLGGDFRFQGQWLESESGLYYMRARDYDSETGLFLSRDAVDMQQQGVEAFNPYQFAFNNPLVFSDPTGLFSIMEINAAENINDILDATQKYIFNQAKQYLIDKAKGIPGQLFERAIQTLLPSTFSNSINEKDVFKSGTKFEDALTLNLCGLLGETFGDALSNLWFQVPVTLSGVPVGDGYGCVVSLIQPPKPPGKVEGFVPKKPDFIIKKGGPSSTDYATNSAFSKAYLIGDVTRTLDGVYNKVKSSQGKAILNYARYRNDHQYNPIALYVTLYGGSQVTYEKTVKFGLENYGVVVLSAVILSNSKNK